MALKEILYDNFTYQISYEIVNLNCSNTVLILHGWGSNKEIMKSSFSKYLQDYRHIYVDLPGFGNSNIHKPLKTVDYASIIKEFLKSLSVKPLVIIGHSFGGKVAVLLNPENLVLLSSAGIPKKKSVKTRLKIRLFKFLKPLGGAKLYRIFATKDVEGMNKTMYETLKNVVDEDFSDIFENYNGRAFLYWGDKDDATPPECGRKIAGLIKNSKFQEFDGDHFFFTKYSRDITDDLERLL